MTETTTPNGYTVEPYASLRSADLQGAVLRDADLSHADLREADLQGAVLRGASLHGANLRYADLHRADLRGADLSYATLAGVDLGMADLRGADLRGADLRGASLRKADLAGARGLRCLASPPEEGGFVAWKVVGRGTLVKLYVPNNAQRTGTYRGRQCRASRVQILEYYGPERASRYRPHFTYPEPGEYVESDGYDPDPRVECTQGIHFFMTRREAEEY